MVNVPVNPNGRNTGDNQKLSRKMLIIKTHSTVFIVKDYERQPIKQVHYKILEECFSLGAMNEGIHKRKLPIDPIRARFTEIRGENPK